MPQRFCMRCGSALAEGAGFCPQCGAVVAPAGADPPAPPAVQAEVASPSSSPRLASRPSRRLFPPLYLAIAAGTAALVVVAYLVLAGGGSDDRISSIGIKIAVPAGWTAEYDPIEEGLLLAAPGTSALWEDLAPTAPRLRVAKFDGSEASTVLPAETLLSQPGLTVIEDPAELTVGGKPAVGMTFEIANGSTRITSRAIVVKVNAGVAYLFRLEAPSADWSTAQSVYSTALQSVSFD